MTFDSNGQQVTEVTSGTGASRYLIEEGIPIPPPRFPDVRPPNKGPQTEWTRVLWSLEVGQSVLTREYKEFRTADNFTQRRPNRKFAIRKINREGWRIWRTA